MKAIIFASLLSWSLLVTSCSSESKDESATAPEDTSSVQDETSTITEETTSSEEGVSGSEESTYVFLTEEKFKEIEAKIHEQDDWSPIAIEGYPKAELVAFHLQSYSEETIETWVDFAHDKMHSFQSTTPTEEQEAKFHEILELPRTLENAHQFMMIMTTEQIETVGY